MIAPDPIDLDDFTQMLRDFLRDPGSYYDGLAEMVDDYDYELLDDLSEAASLIPVGELPNTDVAVCYTDFEQAPYLISTRATGKLRDDPTREIMLINRRCPMLGVPERDIFEWATDFFGVDATRENEDGGYAWLWAVPVSDGIVKDTVRLFVAKAENMAVLDRMTIAVTQ